MSRLRVLANVLTLPPAIAHEVAHLLVVLPWAAQVGVIFDRGGDAEVRVNYRENVPQPAITAAHYAPMVSGAIMGGLAVWWLVSQSVTPQTAQQYLWWSVLAVWWGIYTLPSGSDRDTEVADASP